MASSLPRPSAVCLRGQLSSNVRRREHPLAASIATLEDGPTHVGSRATQVVVEALRRVIKFPPRQRRTKLRHLANHTRLTPSLLLVMLVSFLLHGCASFQGSPDWNAAKSLDQVDPLYQQYIDRYYRATTPQARQRIRNQFIEIRSGLIDRNYAIFKESVYTQRVGTSVGTDIATLFLNAAGAALPDAGVKTGTSALSAGIIGSKTSIDKNVYFDRTLPALLAQMDGRRSEIRGGILAGMATDVERYPLMQAASDLDAYFHAGTISGAISAATTQAATAKVAADTALRNRLPSATEIADELKGRGFEIQRAAQTDTVKTISLCLDDDGNLASAVDTQLSAFLMARGINPAGPGNTAKSDFLNREDQEPLRKAALADTKLGPLIRACQSK